MTSLGAVPEVLAFQWAAERGVHHVHTWDSSLDEGMLSINRGLGFTGVEGVIPVMKTLREMT